jgi:hypothetical protein
LSLRPGGDPGSEKRSRHAVCGAISATCDFMQGAKAKTAGQMSAQVRDAEG